jgi:hypothetical protein
MLGTAIKIVAAQRRADADDSLDRGRNVAGHFLQLPNEVLIHAGLNM